MNTKEILNKSNAEFINGLNRLLQAAEEINNAALHVCRNNKTLAAIVNDKFKHHIAMANIYYQSSFNLRRWYFERKIYNKRFTNKRYIKVN